MRLVKTEIGAKEAMDRFMGHIPVIVENSDGKWMRIFGQAYPLDEDRTAEELKFEPIPKKARRQEYMDKMEEIKKKFGMWAQFKFYKHELVSSGVEPPSIKNQKTID